MRLIIPFEEKIMPPAVLELEGTAEEIRAQLPDFFGQRLHVTICLLTVGENVVDTVPEQRAEADCVFVDAETNEELAARFHRMRDSRLAEKIDYVDADLPTSLAGAVW
jgi:hypothetical protein